MSSPYDSAITERAEELAQELGITSRETIEALETWIASLPPKTLSKSNQSLLSDLEVSGYGYQ